MRSFENDQFELKLDDKNDRKFLIPTAEVILTNMAKDKKSFVAYSDEGKKIWDDIVNMKWQIHHYYGQSYLSNEEIAKQKDNICTLRRLKEITIDFLCLHILQYRILQ